MNSYKPITDAGVLHYRITLPFTRDEAPSRISPRTLSPTIWKRGI